VDLAVIAAFTAAGLSLVNVAISARMASRGQREQWRRDQERPVVARCLTLSANAAGEWWDASVAKQDADAAAPRSQMDAHWEKGRQHLDELRFEVAQLDLLASPAVRATAASLVSEHQRETSRLIMRVKPGQDDFEGRRASQVKIEELHKALVECARADLGLGLPAQPRSLLGKLLAWPGQ